MTKIVFTVTALAFIWIGFGAMCFYDPMALCGIFFPIVSTGMVLDA